MTKCCHKKGSFGEKLSKIGCELFERESFGKSESKRESIGESELKKGVNLSTLPRHQFLESAPPHTHTHTHTGWQTVSD